MPRPTRGAFDPAPEHLHRLVIGQGVVQLDFSVFDIGDDGGEEEGARLIALLSRFGHRGTQPVC
jgi:hypothetical protein